LNCLFCTKANGTKKNQNPKFADSEHTWTVYFAQKQV
jgi:hypothetical protein